MLVASIYILVLLIFALIAFAVMQIKLAGLNVKDFISFIKANDMLDKLYNFAQSRNVSIGDLGMQLEFFLQELSGYTTTYKYVTGNYSAYDISYNFCIEYERPSDTVTTCTNRINNNLDQMLQYVQNGCSN